MNCVEASTTTPRPRSRVLNFPGSAEEGLERDLVRRLAAGDERALDELYRRYAGLVRRVLERMLGESGEAEEVLQEVFLQVWRQARRYSEERASPKRWILVLARSRALDRIKSATASRRREDVVAAEAPPVLLPEGASRLEAVERRSRVHRALVELPVEQRVTLELAYFQGLTQSEIARRTGAPLGTVKSRTLIALRKLRESLGEAA